jgi:class 3 adenylate cyclase
MPNMSVNISLAELKTFARDCFTRAKQTAEDRGIPDRIKFARESVTYMSCSPFVANAMRRYSADEPLSEVESFDAICGWAAFLSFDLRQSTKRAYKVGPRNTFITMHTYLPVVLKVLKSGGGDVFGLRGDGAIAAFGIHRQAKEGEECPNEATEKMVLAACVAGEAVVRAVTRVVNPVLTEGRVEAGLRVGVGIDTGQFVATRIGIDGAEEFTAYGDCVNRSSKLSTGQDSVIVSGKASRALPGKPEGRAGFRRVSPKDDAYFYDYPPDLSPFRG